MDPSSIFVGISLLLVGTVGLGIWFLARATSQRPRGDTWLFDELQKLGARVAQVEVDLTAARGQFTALEEGVSATLERVETKRRSAASAAQRAEAAQEPTQNVNDLPPAERREVLRGIFRQQGRL